MGNIVITSRTEGVKGSANLQKKPKVKTIMISDLDEGSTNDGTFNLTQKGLVYNKTYSLEVLDFIYGIPKSNDVRWECHYTDNGGNITVLSTWKPRGKKVDFKVDDFNILGCFVTFYAYIQEQCNEGVLKVWIHYRFRYLDKKDLRECLNKYGFGKKTNIELSREVSGSIKFNYPIEVATASFGQGITATPIQQLQALTLISNNGKMLTPHIVKKIEDPNTKKTYYKRKVEESEQLVKTSTVNKMKDLMYNVIQGTDPGSTGYPYRIDGFDVIGKTGTSQISENGKYIEGDNAYIFSFAGMYPKNDPEIIIYAAMKKPTWGKSSGLSTNVKDLMKSIAKYKKMFTEVTNNSTLNKIKVKSYTSKKVENVKQELEANGINVLVLGNGDRVVRQSVKKGTSIVSGDRIILMTNDEKYTMPDITGWSRMDAISLCDMLKIKYNVEGYGYVESQSLGAGSEITDNSSINITLKEKYDIEEEDFVSAEIEVVPSGKARDYGLDRSMVAGYGHDDRVCAYTSLTAILDSDVSEYTSCAILVDKEEIGSVGATGAHSLFFENTVAELLLKMGIDSFVQTRLTMSRSKMLSSDVSAGVDPLFVNVNDKKNAAYLGNGIVFNKYTGSRGKSGSNDASAEYVAQVRAVMDNANIHYQTAELGRVDQGGGGTIAYILGNYNMDVIDAGIAVLNMHAPMEIVSKVDVYETYQAYKAFLKDA